MPDQISKKLTDFIIMKEVTSEDYYRKHYERPEWPGVNSGITIGIGYDLGYNTPEDIKRDWGGVIPDATIKEMCRYSGLIRDQAQIKLGQAQVIRVPWEAAYKVFSERTIPKWIKDVKKHLPNTDLLNEDQLGVLVSLAYNRGVNGFDMPWDQRRDKIDKFKEMRAIKTHLVNKEINKIPDELKSMVRIWKLTSLKKRRQEEAALFEGKIGLDKVS